MICSSAGSVTLLLLLLVVVYYDSSCVSDSVDYANAGVCGAGDRFRILSYDQGLENASAYVRIKPWLRDHVSPRVRVDPNIELLDVSGSIHVNQCF